MRQYQNIFLFLFLILIQVILVDTVHAQVEIESKKRKPIWSYFGITPLDDTVLVHKSGFFISPIIYYTPDTRWGGGGAGVYSFHLRDQNDTLDITRTSYIRFLVNYTMNKQTDIWTDWSVFTRKEKFLFKGELRFRNFPDRFYGIGNNTSITDLEKYTYNLFSFKSKVSRKIFNKIYLGLDYHLEIEYGFKHEQGGQLETGLITGYEGGVGSALGLVSIIDTRDNVLNSYSGQYAEFSSYFYTKIFGSTFRFVNLNGMYNKYWQVRPRHILAWQTKARFTFGDVPFLDMSYVGNDDILRGYPKNRFKDRHFIGTQLEYRLPIFWRIGMTAFTGIGDVFAQVQDLTFKSIKYTAGLGLRFAVNPAERVNLRVDYGYGSQGGYFYFSVTEAF